MPDTRATTPLLNEPLRSWHEARRDELRAMATRLNAEMLRLAPGRDEDDVMRWARLSLHDVISDINGEIARLTDEIGDETGDDYAVERGMANFRSAGR